MSFVSNIQKLFLLVCSCIAISSLQAMHKFSDSKVLADRIQGSLMGGCIGDSLGKHTEFKNLDEIFELFPSGAGSYKSLQKVNEKTKLLNINPTSKKKFARYTDDTAMARVTLEVLLNARRNNWDLQTAMGNLAYNYYLDMHKPDGWAAADRAPGLACLAGIREIERRLTAKEHHTNPHWWQGDITTTMGGQGGCGSVMRAHIFGLVFADDPEKAVLWAVEHSKITHKAPIALAACAAMALGTALAVQNKSPDTIISAMIARARNYDVGTADMIQEAFNKARAISPTVGKLSSTATRNSLFEQSKAVFEKYQGWAAHQAIAAATYIFALVPYNIYLAWYLGVHTPGDSDSIASMAGALVGALIGFARLKSVEPDYHRYEGSLTLENKGNLAANLITGVTKSSPPTPENVPALESYTVVSIQEQGKESVTNSAPILPNQPSSWRRYLPWIAGAAAIGAIIYWWNS